MIFALGFLVASLLALLMLPAVNARAAHLARRKAEARLPLSPSEIAAERDFLRAQFAIRERRLERAVEAARAKRHADMAAIGAGTMKVASLSRDLEALERQLADVRLANGNLEATLAQSHEDGTASLATLRALEEAHADLLDSLLAVRGADTAALVASLEAAEQALAGGSGRDEATERENADLRRRITEVADAVIGQARLPRAGAFAVPEPEPERV
ncbi:hypothetical protein [Methylobacterium sp. SD21]|uniref:hypothetical protein n=1 Tax=Methylobacterium litchii TaxID=3138810 RepID=UPI00313B7856